jgi:hypothetical protein
MPGQGYERVRCRLSASRAACACTCTCTCTCTCDDPLSLPQPDGTDCSPQVAGIDQDDSPVTAHGGAQQWPPASPPPSFRSRSSSPNADASRRLLADDPVAAPQDRTLADTFDSDSDDDDDDDGRDDRQRLMRGNPRTEDVASPPGIQRRVTEIPAFNTQAPSSARVYGGGNGGVWANLSAKPTRGEDAEEKPPVSAHIGDSAYRHFADSGHRHTNKPPPTPHHRTGRLQSSPPAPMATKSSSKASPSARSSVSSGTP